ncbi:MAG: tRNA glutamyl-Q(34) synthetase GluQRS [Pseudomonadota bacterium]
MTTAYIGRFAPSPTGPLHFGSLVAAMGSYLEAKSQSGRWLLRIEDLDPPREVAGAGESIIRTLDALGFEWDGSITYQSQRTELYLHALDKFARDGATFRCACSRRQLAAQQIYPGTCRYLNLREKSTSIRLRVTGKIDFVDSIQGNCSETLERECGDFVVRRRDGLFAYQLAVVVDDADQDITHVVRGADLLENTARQIFLQRQLAVSTPQYCHLPVAINKHGEKLSKQTFAPAIEKFSPPAALRSAWEFLGQTNIDASVVDTGEFWQRALALWDINRVPKKPALPCDGFTVPKARL